jgi:hypothetical protein
MFVDSVVFAAQHSESSVGYCVCSRRRVRGALLARSPTRFYTTRRKEGERERLCSFDTTGTRTAREVRRAVRIQR